MIFKEYINMLISRLSIISNLNLAKMYVTLVLNQLPLPKNKNI